LLSTVHRPRPSKVNLDRPQEVVEGFKGSPTTLFINYYPHNLPLSTHSTYHHDEPTDKSIYHY